MIFLTHLCRKLTSCLEIKQHHYSLTCKVSLAKQKGGIAMQMVIGAIGILMIVILGYLTWVLMKEE